MFPSVAAFEQGPFAAACSNLYASEHLMERSLGSRKAGKTPLRAAECYWCSYNSIKEIPLLSVSKPKAYSGNGVSPPGIILLLLAISSSEV